MCMCALEVHWKCKKLQQNVALLCEDAICDDLEIEILGKGFPVNYLSDRTELLDDSLDFQTRAYGWECMFYVSMAAKTRNTFPFQKRRKTPRSREKTGRAPYAVCGPGVIRARRAPNLDTGLISIPLAGCVIRTSCAGADRCLINCKRSPLVSVAVRRDAQ